MPAKSISQQKFFGMVHAMQKGDMKKSGHAGDVAKHIEPSKAKAFASTKTKGLPKKVNEETITCNGDTYKVLKKLVYKGWKLDVVKSEGVYCAVANGKYYGIVGTTIDDAIKEIKYAIDHKNLKEGIVKEAAYGSQSSYKKGDKVTVRSKGFNYNDKNKYVHFDNGVIIRVIPAHGHYASTGMPFPESYEVKISGESTSGVYTAKNMKLGHTATIKEYEHYRDHNNVYDDEGNVTKIQRYKQGGIKPNSTKYASKPQGPSKGTLSKEKPVKEDKLPGGLGDDRSDSDFDAKQLEKGIEVEREHTTDREIAKEIAKDHLTEFPNYYIELEKMENQMKNKNEGMIKLAPMIKNKAINESSFAVLVKLPDHNASDLEARINKVASELNGKVDPYHEGGESYKLLFKSPSGLKTFIDKARALFGRSGAEIEMEESIVDKRPVQMLTTNKKKVTESYNYASPILPTSTKLNSEAPEKNMYTSDWMEDKNSGTIYLISFNGKKVFVYSSGEPDDRYKVGSSREFEHDQTGKRFGNGKTEKVIPLSKLKGSHLGSYPLYVFK